MSPGATPAEVAASIPEPLNEAEWEWRKWVTESMAEGELEALARELAGVQALEQALTASAAAIRLEADKTEKTLGPQSARYIRDQADEVERRRERRALRCQHIREQIRWRKKALNG